MAAAEQGSFAIRSIYHRPEGQCFPNKIGKNDPSVSLAGDPLFFDRVRIRGFILSVDAVKRDGLSINGQGKIALQYKAAVEIYKGLFGMRYGATSPGGVVNYVMKRPAATPVSRPTLSANDDARYRLLTRRARPD